MAAKLFSDISDLNTGHLRVTEKILGSGSYASVYEGYHNGMKCAAKKLHNIFFQYSDERSQQSDAKHAVIRFAEECRVLSQLGSDPNVVEYKGIYWESAGAPAPLLVMECLPVDIDSLMQTCGKLPHEISYHLLHGVASGLKFLHDRETPIVHRDLTARNVLASTNLDAKIADFGMSTGHIRPNSMTQAPGNFVYMPPESMCANPSYDTSIDSFSFGVLVIYMVSGTLPVPHLSAVQSDESGLKAEHEYSRRWEYLDTIGFNHPSMNLIFSCIDNNPSNRSTAADILAQMNDIVAEHPVPPKYMERWKVIIERLERNEDVTDLIALTQLKGHTQIHIKEGGSDSCCLGISCVGSGRQEGSHYSQYSEQKMNIKENSSDSGIEMYSFVERCLREEAVQMSDIILAATSGCSLSFYYTLSGASNVEREIRRILFNKVVSQSLSQEISSHFEYHYAHLTLMADKTTTSNLVAPLIPTTSTYNQLAVAYMHMHTCTPDLTVTLNGQQVVGLLEFSLAQPEFVISHSVSKQIMLLLGAVDLHKGELSVMVSHVSLITSTLCYIDFLLGRIQKLEDPQACAQLLALASYPGPFSSDLVAIISRAETAVASIQHVSTEHNAVHCGGVWSMKGQLLCNYSYQFSPTLAAQMSISVMGTPVAKLKATHVVLSVPVVYPGTPKGGYVVKNHEPTPLKATSTFLHTSVYYYINSNHLYMSFQIALHLSNKLSSLQRFNVRVVCNNFRFTNVNCNVQQLVSLGKQSIDTAVTMNAKINACDHMSQLTAENVNHVFDIDLAFPRKSAFSPISPTAHVYSKPDKMISITGSTTKIASPIAQGPGPGIGSQNPPDTTNTTNHKEPVLTYLPFGTLFQGHSLKHVVASYLLTYSDTCAAADVKTIHTSMLVSLTLNGLKVQELAQFHANLVHAVKGINQLIVVYQLAPSISAIECTRMENCGPVIITISCETQTCVQLDYDQGNKQESRMLMHNGQAMSGRDILSQLNTDQTQDATGSIIVNTNNVLSSKSTHSFKSIASDSIASLNHQEMHFLNQTMQKPLTTTAHLLPQAQQIADKECGRRLLSFCTCIYSCNDTSFSLPLCVYAATEGMQPALMRTPATVNPFIVRSSIKSDYTAEIRKASKTTARKKKFIRKAHKARKVEPSTNGERKNSKFVALSQNVNHLKQGTRVHTDTTRLGKLSSINIYPWLIIKLRTLDDTVYLLIDAYYDYHHLPSNLYYDQPQNVLQQEAIVIVGNKLNHQRSVNFHKAFKNISIRGIQMLSRETTTKQPSLTYASTHMRDSVLITLWDGHCSHHVIGTVPWPSNHTSAHMEHNVGTCKSRITDNPTYLLLFCIPLPSMILRNCVVHKRYINCSTVAS